jgi:hypothetical protein
MLVALIDLLVLLLMLFGLLLAIGSCPPNAAGSDRDQDRGPDR